MSGTPKTVAFLGVSNGVGLAALQRTLTAGHHCTVLCRTPSKLTAIFPTETTPNLKIVPGNAHDVATVSQCLQAPDGQLVDVVVSTIGGAFILSRMTIDDPEVCRKGAATLLEALAQLRRSGLTGNPHIVACSGTGFSRFGRDVPLAVIPFYHFLLKVPHEDKIAMEDRIVESKELFTVVRIGWLTAGNSTAEIRIGIEDPKAGLESTAIGYTISREDAGKWIAENLVLKRQPRYNNKTAMITY